MSSAGAHTAAEGADRRDVERAFARCFAGHDGAVVLAHLRRTTLERSLGPEAGEAALRHLEGQRAVVLRIAALIERGHG
jgi:hypothetical protein